MTINRVQRSIRLGLFLLLMLFSHACAWSFDIAPAGNMESQSRENRPAVKVKRVRLGQPLQVECTLDGLDDYKFDRIVFYRSLLDLAEESNEAEPAITSSEPSLAKPAREMTSAGESALVFESRQNLDRHLGLLLQNSGHKTGYEWHRSPLKVSRAAYHDSGRYFCVYASKINTKWLATSSLFLIYDDQVLFKSFQETAELDPCVDDLLNVDEAELNKIQWFYNDPIQDDASLISIDSKTSKLVVQLINPNLFNTFFNCFNSQTGAFKYYRIECSDCNDILAAPIIAPHHQVAPVGSSTQFTCERSSLSVNEPDRFQWFKQRPIAVDPTKRRENPTTNEPNDIQYNTSKSIGFGPVLTLSNLTLQDGGWYVCCVVAAPDTEIEERKDALAADEKLQLKFKYACSTADLEVQDLGPLPKVPNRRIRVILALILIFFVVIVSLMALVMYLCHRKIKVFKHTHEAVSALQNNDFYQRNPLNSLKQSLSGGTGTATTTTTTSNMWTDSSLEQLLDSKAAELDSFEDILKSSSSIETLLTDDEVKQWRIPIDALEIGEVVGRGAFGIVMQAKLRQRPQNNVSGDNDSGLDSLTYLSSSSSTKKKNGNSDVWVAVKKLPENATPKNFYDLFKELKLMFQVGQHANIVNLIGYCVESSSLLIVTDFARYGNLKEFLRAHARDPDRQSKKINREHLLVYSYQIALGMEYLHSKKVLHRDLAARNILVDDYDSIKIADFGLARNIRSDYYYVQKINSKIPLKWMSPESLIYNKMSKESDVWSFGVLLWEIFTLGCTPYPSFSNEELLERLKSGYRMPRPSLCDPQVYEQCLLACWRDDPKQRPSFASLARLLDQIHHQPSASSVAPGLVDESISAVEFIDQSPNLDGDDLSGKAKPVLRDREHPVRLIMPSESSFNKSTSVSTNATHYTTTGSQRSGQSASTSSSSASSLVFDDKIERDSSHFRRERKGLKSIESEEKEEDSIEKMENRSDTVYIVPSRDTKSTSSSADVNGRQTKKAIYEEGTAEEKKLIHPLKLNESAPIIIDTNGSGGLRSASRNLLNRLSNTINGHGNSRGRPERPLVSIV